MSEPKLNFVVDRAQQAGSPRIIFSFIVDNDSHFAYKGWHLARSLVAHCGGNASAIHVQCTPEVSEHTRNLFRECGYQVQQIARFGDGRYCNKLNQLENLRDIDFDRVVLLDTDTIVISDIRPFLSDKAIGGVIVGHARPPLATLQEIAAASGLSILPPVCPTAVGGEDTYLANCNGGFYSVPKAYCEVLSREWRRWALWLLDNIEPLSRIGRQNHVDQVSFWLAVQHEGLPFERAPSNVNYHIHIDGKHFYLDETRDIALLHYHNQLNVVGLLEIPPGRSPREQAAVARANEQIGGGFDNRLFWELRYQNFPERGSGLGSRGDNLLYKRLLLKEQGIEEAPSVLDVGCGDLEVVKELDITRYVGIDQSVNAIDIARAARPDWEFRLAPAPDVAATQMVLCFEVLIHQKTEADYRALIAFLAEKTLGTLLVSGFQSGSEAIDQNPIVFFYEPLEEGLRRTARFRSIQPIGKHTSVVVYRCDI
jgi:hypothetical protein